MPPAPAPRRKIKKIVGGHGHHGGAWKVAYADFVTAMMALFMVLWLLASTDPKARHEIANYFRTGILPDGEMAMKNAAQARPSVFEEAPSLQQAHEATLDEQARDLEKAIQELVARDSQLTELAKYVTVRVTPDGVLIEVVDHEGKDDLLFDSASARLKPALTHFLGELAPVLAERSNALEVHGNTDARRFVSGANKDNWDLSYERATAARHILENSGVREGQVVGVVASGAAMPYDPNDPIAASNRRLSILLRRNVGQATSADDVKPVIAPAAPVAPVVTPPAPTASAATAAAASAIH
jgi:chemotaxis protein MotB